MVKTNGAFKLSKETKRILASMPQEKAGDYKRMMIDAEVSEAKAKLAKIKTGKNEAKVD
jgi:hypothetical protein